MIAVTGATGEVGRRVVAHLAAAGVPHFSVVRDAARAAGDHRVASDYGARDEMIAAFAGANTVFLVAAAENAERVEQHKTAVDAALARASRGSCTSPSCARRRTRRSPSPATTGRPRSTSARPACAGPSCA